MNQVELGAGGVRLRDLPFWLSKGCRGWGLASLGHTAKVVSEPSA